MADIIVVATNNKKISTLSFIRFPRHSPISVFGINWNNPSWIFIKEEATITRKKATCIFIPVLDETSVPISVDAKITTIVKNWNNSVKLNKIIVNAAAIAAKVISCIKRVFLCKFIILVYQNWKLNNKPILYLLKNILNYRMIWTKKSNATLNFLSSPFCGPW